MKTYINIDTLEYPVYEHVIKQRYKNKSWPSTFIPPAEYQEVLTTNRPVVDKWLKKVVEISPIKENDKWYKAWQIIDLSEQEKERIFTIALYNIKKDFSEQVQSRLNLFARTRGYDDIVTACSYSLSLDPIFKLEGQRCVELRDATWKKLYEIIAEIGEKRRSFTNNFKDIEIELPSLSWIDANKTINNV